MIRQLTYDDRDSIREVINTRNKLFMSEASVLSTFGFLERQDIFESNLTFGYFEEDKLDAFTYITLWTELPAYCQLIYTRKRDNRLKNDNNVDINLAKLLKYSIYHIGNTLNLWEEYRVTAVDWPSTQPDIHILDTIEIVPAGTVSRYPLFRTRLLNRVLTHPVKISRRLIKPELRNEPYVQLAD